MFRNNESVSTTRENYNLVSHSSGDIQKLCDRVFWIEQHEIKAEGLPEDVIKLYHAEQ